MDGNVLIEPDFQAFIGALRASRQESEGRGFFFLVSTGVWAGWVGRAWASREGSRRPILMCLVTPWVPWVEGIRDRDITRDPGSLPHPIKLTQDLILPPPPPVRPSLLVSIACKNRGLNPTLPQLGQCVNGMGFHEIPSPAYRIPLFFMLLLA